MGTARWRIEQLNCKVIGPNRNDNLDRVEDMNLNPLSYDPTNLIRPRNDLSLTFGPGRSENDEIV